MYKQKLTFPLSLLLCRLQFGLPALSWAATLTTTLLLLLTGNLAKYRIPADQAVSPEDNLRCRSQWEAEEALGSVNTVT